MLSVESWVEKNDKTKKTYDFVCNANDGEREISAKEKDDLLRFFKKQILCHFFLEYTTRHNNIPEYTSFG